MLRGRKKLKPKKWKKGLKKTRNGQKQARRNSPYFKISVSNFIQKRKKRSFEGFRTDKQNGAHCLVNVFVFFLASFSFSSSPPPSEFLVRLFLPTSSLSCACTTSEAARSEERIHLWVRFRWLGSFRRGGFERFPWENWVSSRVFFVFSLERFVRRMSLSIHFFG